MLVQKLIITMVTLIMQLLGKKNTMEPPRCHALVYFSRHQRG